MSGPQKFWREGRDIYQRCGPDGAAAQSAPTLRSGPPEDRAQVSLVVTDFRSPANGVFPHWPLRAGDSPRIQWDVDHVPGERLSVKTRWKHVSLLEVADACHAPAAPESWTVFHIRAPPQLLTCFSGARHAQFSYLTNAHWPLRREAGLVLKNVANLCKYTYLLWISNRL